MMHLRTKKRNLIKVKTGRTLLKFPDGTIETDGHFIWVFVGGLVPSPCGGQARNCILRLSIDDSLHTHLVDVKTFFKHGFIDGKISREPQP